MTDSTSMSAKNRQIHTDRTQKRASQGLGDRGVDGELVFNGYRVPVWDG